MSDARQLTAPPGPGEVVRELAVDSIRPNPYQPRCTFDQEGLAELARSIEAAGGLSANHCPAPGPQFEPLRINCRGTALAGDQDD